MATAISHPASDSRSGQGPNLFQRTMGFMLTHLLSNHGKRVMFVTSLYFRVVRIETLKDEAIEKLNDIMQLATNQAGMEFPALFHNLVWRGTGVSETLKRNLVVEDISDEEVQDLSERVVDLSPAWIRYGDRAVMVKDVFDLISNGSELAAAA